MKKITIYAKSKKQVQRYDVFIYEKYLLKLLNELDDYYGVKKEENEYYGPLIPELKSDEFYEPVSLKLVNSNDSGNLYIYKIRHIKAVGLSKIIRKILNGNYLEASYAINDLFNYNFKDDKEKLFLDEVKSCFHFKKSNKKFDLTRSILNFERMMLEDDVSIRYIDDKTLSKTDNLPSIYSFMLKRE